MNKERYCHNCHWWHKVYGCTYNYPEYWIRVAKFQRIMDKQELIKFLKENLKVDIWCDESYDYKHINVSISLCDEEICSSSDYL